MLEGDISQINLVERLVELWHEQFTGAIRFENDGIIKIVYFKGGDILSASTNDRSDSIDEILMRAGKVSREHVKQALAKRKENETLGDALLNLGFITRKELTWARRIQVVGVIRSIIAWEEGSFTIVADYLPKRDEGTLFALPQVLVELIVTDQDKARFEHALEGGNVVFEKTPQFDAVWPRLGLNEDAEAIAAEIDGSKNANEIATASGRDTFNVYKLLEAFSTLGMLARSTGAKPQATPQFALDDFAAAGVADAADMWNDSAPVSMQRFELDDEPAIPRETHLPPVTVPPSEELYRPSAPTSWDEPEGEDLPVDLGAAPVRQPAWDAPPRTPLAVPMPASIEPPAEPEQQWGFDEAQIETARRAAMPAAAASASASRKPILTQTTKRTPRYGLLVTLMVLFILAGAGYFGWQWWQGRQESTPVAVNQPVKRPAPISPVPISPAPTTTIAEGTIAPGTQASGLTTTDTTATAPAAAATTTPTPAVITAPAPTPVPTAPVSAAPAASPSSALPRVTAKGGRERLDAMAREFASNRTGNFTVQIQILCEPSNVEQTMRAGGEKVWFVPQTIGARSCYRVFWGRYDSREAAQRAIAEIPAALRDRSAAVKPVPRG